LDYFSPYYTILKIIITCSVWGLSFFVHPLKAQVFQDTVFKNKAIQGLESLYNMDFTQAQKTFRGLNIEYPSEPAPHFLNALCTWWKISISRDFKGYDKAFLSDIDSALYKCDKVSRKSGDRMEYAYMMFNVLAFKSRFHAMRGDWMTAANTARKALPYLMEGKKYLNQTDEFHFALGLYDYFAVYYPEKHPVTRPFMIFFPSGNKERGIQMLNKACNVVNFSRNEARFFLMRILIDDAPDYVRALKLASFLTQRYPGNSIYKLYYAKALYYNRDYEMSNKVLLDFEKKHLSLKLEKGSRVEQMQSIYTTQLMFEVWYFLGKIQLKIMPDSGYALLYFQKAESVLALCQEADPLIHEDLLFQTGLCLDQLGKRSSAQSYYKEALKISTDSERKKKLQECIKAPCTN